jgi:hypothetical protein
VQAIAQDQTRLQSLLAAAQEQHAFQSHFSLASVGRNHEEKVRSILNRHPLVVRLEGGLFSIPFAVLMEIANYSDVGVYSQRDLEVVSRNHTVGGAFVTLPCMPYYRNMMARYVLEISQRFRRAGFERFDLVMVGDGAGHLGGAMGAALQKQGVNFRLIHADISPGLLDQQREHYLQCGIDPLRINAVRGPLLDLPELLRASIFDFSGGFFVLYEVLDALRADSVFLLDGELHEMRFLVNFEKDRVNHHLVPLEAPGWQPYVNPALVKCVRKIPAYLEGKEPRAFPFSADYLLAIKALMDCAPRSVFYFGDYAGQFAHWPTTDLPMRIFSAGELDFNVQDYESILFQLTDATVDVDPGLLYLVGGLGGKVDFLSPQYDFLSRFDTSLELRVPFEVRQIEEKFREGRYTVERMEAFDNDVVFLHHILIPAVFAAQISRGM